MVERVRLAHAESLWKVGRHAEAEELYVKAKSAAVVVGLYVGIKAWDDAMRVARAYCNNKKVKWVDMQRVFVEEEDDDVNVSNSNQDDSSKRAYADHDVDVYANKNDENTGEKSVDVHSLSPIRTRQSPNSRSPTQTQTASRSPNNSNNQTQSPARVRGSGTGQNDPDNSGQNYPGSPGVEFGWGKGRHLLDEESGVFYGVGMYVCL